MLDQTSTEGYHNLVRRDVFPITPEKAGRVLDLGGGIGATSAALKAEGRAEHVTLADLVADTALPEIDAAYGGNLEDPAFLQKIIQEQGPFDTILCLDVLEHLLEPWDVVRALSDGLKPGGQIVCSLPNARCILLVWPLVVKGRFDLHDAGICDRTHLRWFARANAIELMQEGGLQIEVVENKLLEARRFRYLNMLTLGLFRRFFEIQYLIRARKPG